jgi:deoxyribodipyrimidine photo-lyase
MRGFIAIADVLVSPSLKALVARSAYLLRSRGSPRTLIDAGTEYQIDMEGHGTALAPEVTTRQRMREVKERPYEGGTVVYWMGRDQRVDDNWALLYAAQLANSTGSQLCVTFCLAPKHLASSMRQYAFMVKGLKEQEERFAGLGMGFALLEGYPEIEFPTFLSHIQARLLITDFNPLREWRAWSRRVASEIDIAVHEVDAHNIVPCWTVATYRIQTYATFRQRINPLLIEFLTDLPPIGRMKRPWEGERPSVDWEGALSRTKVNMDVPEVNWLLPGEKAGKAALAEFLKNRLVEYPERGMDPLVNGQSDLSPYLHFGQLSAQRVALEVRKCDAPEESKAKYLDNLIVKRELSDNFCLHTPDYDTTAAFPVWAKRSLDEHRSDPREHLYSLDELDHGKSYDPLWNAAQTELVKHGKIHGSLRHYWAARILEWTRSPEEAFAFAVHLNDRYGLDGWDPSGYSGIAMVIGGLYGKPWQAKEVMGKVQRLTYTGERLRYDVHAYQEKVKNL